MNAALARSRTAPILLGLGTLVAFVALIQILISAGVLNKFIVPPPWEVALAFERVILEEHIVERFLLTMKECVSAAALLAVFGISIGTLLYKVNILRQADANQIVERVVGRPLLSRNQAGEQESGQQYPEPDHAESPPTIF